MTYVFHHRFRGLLLGSAIVAIACRGKAVPTESVQIANARVTATTASLHSATIVDPPSNVTRYVYPSQVPSYSVNTSTQFKLNGTFQIINGSASWVRDVRWRACGSTGAGNIRYSASTPIVSGQAYDVDYTQPASFTPGAYGQYEILARSIKRLCTDGGFCSDADSVRSVRCVTLADFSVAISGPSTVFADRSVGWTANVFGTATPFTYQWYRDGSPAGNGQSVTLNTGPSNFLLRVDVTDANNELRTDSRLVIVQLAPPTNCQLTYIPQPKYLRVTWANSGDPGVSTEVEVQRNGGPWTLAGTAAPGSTQFIYTLGSQTGLFYARIRHVKQGYNASSYCSTNSVTV